MKYLRDVVVNTLVGGLFVLLPIYLAILLLLKGLQSAMGLVHPISAFLPDWMPAKNLLSVLAVLIVCVVVGAAARTRVGRAIRERMEMSLFGRLPGYGLFRSLTQRLAG